MKPKLPIYLDNQATTPVDPRVMEAIMPLFTRHYGNAASTEHTFGWEAEALVSNARETIAQAIGASSASEIIFTSGATESNNLALCGAMKRYHSKGRHLITVASEHKAVLDTCAALERDGCRITCLGVGRDGLVDVAALAAAIEPDTVLVSVMAANNEIGVLQPLTEIGAITRAAGVLFHSDAAQAVGKVPLDVEAAAIDLLSISGHKLYAPKGIGALYVRRRRPRVTLIPGIHGGGHERGLRSGTLNVPGIVGLAKALEISDVASEGARLRVLREALWQGLTRSLDGIILNGHAEQRLPGNLNVYFPEVAIEKLVREIYSEIAISTGAACTSASPQPSHVLCALYDDDKAAMASVRFGLGRFTTEQEIDYTVARIAAADALRHLRRI